ncbi:MAG TPA: hypothetical protein VF719_10065 [Abditibacteriaceae bacterium]|jgi:hypothetical protein
MIEIRNRSASTIMRPAALVVAASMLVPTLSGCGSQQASAPPPPMDASRNSRMPAPAGSQQRAGGMTGKQKLVLLAGAAALYYMYKRKQNAAGQQVQYYQSKNGRIYYRDPKTKQAIWVTPPQGGIQVPANEAQEYSNYQGYENRNDGQEFGRYGSGGFSAPAQF